MYKIDIIILSVLSIWLNLSLSIHGHYDNDIVRDLVSLRILRVLRSLSWNSLTMGNSVYGCYYSFCCSTILTITSGVARIKWR